MAWKKITYREYDNLKNKCFLRFLKEKHVFGNYKNNRSKHFGDSIPSVGLRDIILWSFPLYSSDEGIEFWSVINNESKKLDYHFLKNVTIIR